MTQWYKLQRTTFLIRYLSWCILLYVKLIWCSGVPEIYGGWGVGMSAMGICAFLCSGVPEIYDQMGGEREGG